MVGCHFFLVKNKTFVQNLNFCWFNKKSLIVVGRIEKNFVLNIKLVVNINNSVLNQEELYCLIHYNSNGLCRPFYLKWWLWLKSYSNTITMVRIHVNIMTGGEIVVNLGCHFPCHLLVILSQPVGEGVWVKDSFTLLENMTWQSGVRSN